MKKLHKTKKLDQRFKANKAITKKTKIAAAILTLLVVLGGLFKVGMVIAGWFDTHAIIQQQVLKVDLNAPFRVEERKVEVADIIQVVEAMPEPQNLETDFDKYVYEVFGVENYKMALAVSKCEGYNHPVDDFSLNTNNTIDVGKFRINSIHFEKEGCSLAEVITMKGNVDCAYKIWEGKEVDGQGSFDPWVGYWNGCAITKL